MLVELWVQPLHIIVRPIKNALYSPRSAIIAVLLEGGRFLAIDMVRGSAVLPMLTSSSSIVATRREISIPRSNAS